MSYDDVLFVGRGSTAVCWYRCAMPATFLGADWVGFIGDPPKLLMQTGIVKGETATPRWSDYEVVVIQQPFGLGWLNVIHELQSHGVRVLYEIDDYLHGVRKVADHDYREDFDKKAIAELEMCMRVCDGMIVSTDYLARRYKRFNKNIHVCRNGLDLGRYNLTVPERESGGTHIGWAGATGHDAAVLPWLGEVGRIMERRGNVCFVSIGIEYADPIAARWPTRAVSIPFVLLDGYPAAMTLMDIAIAPAASGSWARAKSDLRFLEAGALGIPIVADPLVYPEVEHCVNGMVARSPAEAGRAIEQLLDDQSLRRELGANAREHVRSTRDMRVMAGRWAEVIDGVR